MQNKTLIGVVVGLVIVIAIIWGIKASNKSSDTVSSVNKGSLYVGVTDATLDITNVDDINLAVKKVEIYSPTKGWVTVSSNQKNFDLLTLKSSGEVQMYANSTMDQDTYSKVRVTLGDANIKTKTKGTVRAVLPASQVVMNEQVRVADGQSTQIKLDFLADKSLHSTTDGKYVFAPVINSESRSNTQITSGNNSVLTTFGGNVDDNVSVGVDLSGSSRSNFQLTTDNTLQIKSSSGGITNFILSGKSFTADDNMDKEDEADGNILNGNINTDTNTSTSTNTTNTNSGSTSGSGSANTKTNTTGGLNLDIY
jgi:hypothetical protein